MVLNQKYQTQPTAIASYDYTDIAEGTGTVVYYGFQDEDSVGVSYNLSNQLFYSSAIETTVDITQYSNFSASTDYDFDLTGFNTPKRIKGTARIQQGIALGGRADEHAWMYLTYNIIHYDGTTETIIGTNTSETFETTSATITPNIVNLPITLTETSFKKGDILRVEEKIFISGAGFTNVGEAYIAHDPQNRDGTAVIPSTDDVISRFEVHVPYNLDL